VTVKHPQFGTVCEICYVGLTPERCAVDANDVRWDVCSGECARLAGIAEAVGGRHVVPMPVRIASLPRNAVGYPIPWFVARLDDGTRDFRIAGKTQYITALRRRLCWICGQPLGRYVAFTIGPMCAVNRISAEPPAHRDCGIYAAQVCPFLSNPTMRRREVSGDITAAAGKPLLRNPGVALVWVTRDYRPFRAHAGNDGILIEVGEPVETLWYAEGREATRVEVLAAMEAGIPALRDACRHDDDPAASLAELDGDYQRALALVPSK
jgi:hypothetical protein